MKQDKELTPIEFARKLRRQPTSSEVSLWHALRNRRRGFKFRRQHSMGPFIADFFCLEAKLVVESDGKDHFTSSGMAYDSFRDQWMQEHGIEVLRFSGHQIDQNIEQVLATIDSKLEERTSKSVSEARQNKERNLSTAMRVEDSTSRPSPPAPSPVRTGEGVPEASTQQAPSIASSLLPPLAHSHERDSSLPPLARSSGRGAGGEGLPRSITSENMEAVFRHPQGFTLVELLAVIVIIGILSSLVIQALSSARQDALAAKTRATIAKIDAVLNEKMDEYLSKPLSFQTDASDSTYYRVERFPFANQKLSVSGNAAIVSSIAGTPSGGLLRERIRLAASRDLMRLEMPDCVADVFATGYTSIANGLTAARVPIAIATGYQASYPPPPALATNTQRLVMRVNLPGDFNRIVNRVLQADAATSMGNWSKSYPNEELLFQIVEGSFLDGTSAIEGFAASEIGDVDGDGLQEFIDAWGTPIRWIRWPSGLRSTAPFNVDPLNTANPIGTDPYDPAQADMGFDISNSYGNTFPYAPNFYPRPLVVSAGPDSRFGVRFYVVDSSNNQASAAVSSSGLQLPLPYSPSSFNAPAYWSSGFNWPDPFYPRNNMAARLGATADTSIDTVDEPIGVDLSANPPTLIASPNPSPNTYAEQAADNISNLDESGASL